MSDFFDSIFHSDIVDTIVGYVFVFGLGLFFYIANWCCFINNMIPGRKWVSLVPPLGGLILALAFLLLVPAPWKWFALLGLTDPWIISFVYAIITEAFGKSEKKEDKEEENDGEHDN
jgi:hypothetical protein